MPDSREHGQGGRTLFFLAGSLRQLQQHTVTPSLWCISKAFKHLTMLELIVPWEDQTEEANEKESLQVSGAGGGVRGQWLEHHLRAKLAAEAMQVSLNVKSFAEWV